MSAPDYDALEAVVAAATSGPYAVVPMPRHPGVWDIWGVRHDEVIGDGDVRVAEVRGYEADAAYIATFDPSMVADLLARARERDAATAERDRLLDGLEALIDTSDAADADCGSCSQKSSHARQLRTLLDQTANDGNAT